MIPRAHVTAWRRRAPWPDDALVEQDLVLSRAIVAMFSSDVVCEQLALRGGTALHKLFFDPPARFSEDIDLVQIAAGPIGPAMNAMRDCMDGWLGRPGTKQGQDRVTLLYRFDSDLHPVGRRRLKIEINTREHFDVLGIDRRPYGMSNPWFEGNATTTVYHLDELLGTKLRALYQRNKGRDLFDLAIALDTPGVSPERVVRCFQGYMEHGEGRVSRARFEANLAAKTRDRSFSEDVDPLLAHGTAWNFEAAIRAVSEKLVALLPGRPWKGEAFTGRAD